MFLDPHQTALVRDSFTQLRPFADRAATALVAQTLIDGAPGVAVREAS